MKPIERKVFRCAIYTRKSTEHNLDLEFNSLDAQREACEAYIKSHAHEGWRLVADRYDDGGVSGASLERPALQTLLADVRAGKINTVAVYKVDRLTRSLADFAKLVELFDQYGVSFVSITQSFNTTSSMGRLTLNVLLSFAQFEREVIGERVRDKIAASKRRGLWVGGPVPLGYATVDRRLVINRPEADVVRKIFRQYLRLGRVEQLKDYLHRAKILSKIRTSNAGRKSGGTSFSRGALYHLLSNRVFIGEIVHHKQNYPGQHEAIIQRSLWDQVAARLKANNQAHRSTKSQSSASLLSGIVFDAKGVRLTPTHAVKRGKRYRYYTSQDAIKRIGDRAAVTRFPAQEIEGLVAAQIHLLLQSTDKCTNGIKRSPDKDVAAERAKDLARRWPKLETSAQHEFIKNVLRRVVVGQTAVWIEVDRAKLVETLLGRKPESGTANHKNQPDLIKLTSNFQPHRRRGELYFVTPKISHPDRAPIPGLVKAVARARDWYEQIVTGEVAHVAEIARKTGMPSCDVKYALKFAMLSPQVTEAILAGKHPPNLTLRDLRSSISIDWKEQQERILQLQ